MPQAAQRLLKTWADWGVLGEQGKGVYATVPRLPMGDVATRLVVRARLAAEGGRPIPIADMATLPDLFPFNLGEGHGSYVAPLADAYGAADLRRALRQGFRGGKLLKKHEHFWVEGALAASNPGLRRLLATARGLPRAARRG